MSEPLEARLRALAEARGGEAWLRRRPSAESEAVRDAAVLMLFGRGTPPRTDAGLAQGAGLGDAADVDVLLLQRASTLRQHAGEVAFPGGGRETGDADLVTTALREAQEETGVDPAGVDVLAQLDPLYVPVSGFDVTPIVAWWREPGDVTVVDEGESSLVYRVPIADLVAPENRGSYRHPLGFVGPAFDVGVFQIWGFTAGVLDFALDALGWSVPWDVDRGIDIPQ